MQSFFARYPKAGAGASARQQSLDQVNMNIEWIQHRHDNLQQALYTMQHE
jgi:hypothetical protein